MKMIVMMMSIMRLMGFEERLFLRIESWLCTLQVRERDESGKLRWIVDLEGHEHVDI